MEQSYKEKFYNCYKKLLPSMQQIESERKKMLAIHKFLYAMVHIIFASIVFWFIVKTGVAIIYDKTGNNLEHLMALFAVICGLLALYSFMIPAFTQHSNHKKFAKIMKEKYFKNLIPVFDFIKITNIEELPESIMYHKMRASKGGGYIEPEIDDNFVGCYKDVKFSIIEVDNINLRGKMGCYSGPWGGIILNLEFNKSASTNVFISPQSDLGYIIGIIGTIFMSVIGLTVAIMSPGDFFVGFLVFLLGLFCTVSLIGNFFYVKNQKVSLEDNNFHKKYYVECDNQIEARYILTPSFMERLKSLETSFHSNNITCMVQGNQIIFAIKTNNDLFEIGNLNVPVTNPKQVQQFCDEITAICDMIDYFKLNERTGL